MPASCVHPPRLGVHEKAVGCHLDPLDPGSSQVRQQHLQSKIHEPGTIHSGRTTKRSRPRSRKVGQNPELAPPGRPQLAPPGSGRIYVSVTDREQRGSWSRAHLPRTVHPIMARSRPVSDARAPRATAGAAGKRSPFEQSVAEVREHLGLGGDSSLDDDVLRKELQNLVGEGEQVMSQAVRQR